ncbi:MAG: DUF732 domain-containing protein [Mycobacterium sp.]
MRLVLALTCVAAVIGTAAPAHADVDGNDQSFLAALKQAGLTYEDPERAITAGKEVCNLVDGGMTGVEIVKNLQELNPGFEDNGAAQFTAIAASAYCPKTLAGVGHGATPKSGG